MSTPLQWPPDPNDPFFRQHADRLASQAPIVLRILYFLKWKYPLLKYVAVKYTREVARR